MKKKIFSTEKFREYWANKPEKETLMCIPYYLDEWIKECIGLTKEECNDKGYAARPEWFEEVEVPDEVEEEVATDESKN